MQNPHEADPRFGESRTSFHAPRYIRVTRGDGRLVSSQQDGATTDGKPIVEIPVTATNGGVVIPNDQVSRRSAVGFHVESSIVIPQERSLLVEGWREAEIRIRTSKKGSLMTRRNGTQYFAPPGRKFLDVRPIGKDWELDVMSDDEEPYCEAETRMLFSEYRRHQESLRRPSDRPRYLQLGYGLGHTLKYVFREAGSTRGVDIVLVELNKNIEDRAASEIDLQLRRIKLAHPGLQINVTLIGDDAYHVLDVFADAITNKKGVIPDETFRSVRRFTTKDRPAELRNKPVSAEEIPLVAKVFQMTETDIYPIDKEGDKDGTDNLNKAASLKACMDKDGCGTYYSHFKGFTEGGISQRQKDILNAHHFAYKTSDRDVPLKPSKENSYLIEPDGFPLDFLTPILFWHKIEEEAA